MLLAWLTNNYWMTNFQADQGGRLRFRFALLPAEATAATAKGSRMPSPMFARSPLTFMRGGAKFAMNRKPSFSQTWAR